MFKCRETFRLASKRKPEDKWENQNRGPKVQSVGLAEMPWPPSSFSERTYLWIEPEPGSGVKTSARQNHEVHGGRTRSWNYKNGQIKNSCLPKRGKATGAEMAAIWSTEGGVLSFRRALKGSLEPKKQVCQKNTYTPCSGAMPMDKFKGSSKGDHHHWVPNLPIFQQTPSKITPHPQTSKTQINRRGQTSRSSHGNHKKRSI